MSNTPRTDAAAWREHQQSVVDADFVRELERDLAQRTAALDQMTVHRHATIAHRDITQQVLNGITVALSQRTADLAQRTAERDEARREVCELRADLRVKPTFKREVAAERGWDCFKEVQP